MTQIEDMLRDALAETPVPAAHSDPLGAVDRRVRRARRRLAVGAGLAVVALTAAVVVPLTTLSGGGDARVDIGGTPTPTSTAPSDEAPDADVWMPQGAHGVAGYDGGLWVIAQPASDEPQRSLIQLGPDGEAVSETPLDDPVDFVAAGDAFDRTRVYAWGGGDGAYPDALVQTVDRLGSVLSLRLPGMTVLDLTVLHGDAWATVPDAVLQIGIRDGSLQVLSRTDVVGAHRIVVTQAGHLWVQADTDLVQLVPTGGRGPEVGVTEHWVGPLLGSTGQDAVWTTDDPERAVELDPASLAAGVSVSLVGKRLSTHGKPFDLVVDESGGVFVATDTGDVEYFAADSAFGPVTDRLREIDVETMAAAPGGGVVVSTFSGALEHWDPAP